MKQVFLILSSKCFGIHQFIEFSNIFYLAACFFSYFRVPALHENVPNLEATEVKLPTTSFMFESEFKRLKNNQESFYSYLKVS